MSTVDINGLGRIGRAALKILLDADGLDLVAVGGREPGLALVLDAEGVDPRPLHRDREIGRRGVDMPANRTGSPVSTPKGTMSSISKSIAWPTRTL